MIQSRKENSKQKNRPETTCENPSNSGTHNFRMPSNKVLKECNIIKDRTNNKISKK